MSNLAVERALILLRYVVDNPAGLSIREASRNLGYSPATVQKLVQALESQGYVVQDPATNRYLLGPEAVQMGLAALSRLELRRVAHPYLEEISKQTQETVLLTMPRSDYAVYVDKVVSTQPIHMDAPLGALRPYNCTAVGKILLMDMPVEKIEELARKGVFEQRTSRSIVDLNALENEIDQVRTNGWSQDNGEYIDGLNCIAVPVYNHEGKIVAAVTVSGPAERVHANFDSFLEMLKVNSLAISKELGYRPTQDNGRSAANSIKNK